MSVPVFLYGTFTATTAGGLDIVFLWDRARAAAFISGHRVFFVQKRFANVRSFARLCTSSFAREN